MEDFGTLMGVTTNDDGGWAQMVLVNGDHVAAIVAQAKATQEADEAASEPEIKL